MEIKEQSDKLYDVVVIGGGGSGMIASIIASQNGNRVLLVDKLSSLGVKLKATGGGKCNLTNRLSQDKFIENFGRNGRFIRDALSQFGSDDLVEFLLDIGVDTTSLDGFRVFPRSRNSNTVLQAFIKELNRLNVKIELNQLVINITIKENIFTIYTKSNSFNTKNIIIATGGLGFASLGATNDGYKLIKSLGHSITPLYPAMMPLKTRELWVGNCRADTISKVEIRVDIKKHKKLKAKGDLIFTKNGIRGPVVLDFAREITPLIEKYGEVPIILNLIKGKNEEDIRVYFKSKLSSQSSILEIISTLLPTPLAKEILNLSNIQTDIKLKDISGYNRDILIKNLVWTPLTIVKSNFDNAMITRGGVSLKEINPKSMQSKSIKGLYFCGEVVDIDGPCGGYNLQWAFSSGVLAGKLLNL